MIKSILSAFLVLSIYIANAQEINLAPDQNPNYKASQAKYEAAKDKLLEGMNTTEQKTYKAYDWTEAKQERRQQRRDNRQQRALARINNPGYYWNNWNSWNNCYSPYYMFGPRNIFFIY